MAIGSVARRPGRRAALVWIGGVVVLLGTIAWAVVPGSTRPIVATAQELSVPSSWRLVREHVTPPRVLCWGGDPCPSLYRTWSVGALVEHGELEDLIAATGWEVSMDPTYPGCAVNPGIVGEQTVCRASGSTGAGHRVVLTQRADPQDPAAGTVQLFLGPPG
jgi:hypothetical protein